MYNSNFEASLKSKFKDSQSLKAIIGKQKVCDNVIEKGGPIPGLESSRTQQLQPYGSGLRVKNRKVY